MPNLTVRDIPEAAYQKIKERAIANKRSINSEILYGLEQYYCRSRQDQNATLENVRRIRAKTENRIYLTEKEITQGKNEGRA